MAKKLFLLLSIIFASQACAEPAKPEIPLPNKEFINKRIEEYDEKLSNYLHIPIKKFSSILTDILDFIYSEEISPLQKEIKQLRQELADVKNDLKVTKGQIHTLTTQIETMLHAHKNTQNDIK